MVLTFNMPPHNTLVRPVEPMNSFAGELPVPKSMRARRSLLRASCVAE
jgi:hypothetical protein